MKWATIFALQCIGICADVLVWSPSRILDEGRGQYQSADATCLVAGLFDRSPLGKCFPDNSFDLHLSKSAESLSCIVVLLLTDHQNVQYLLGSYADSGVSTLFDLLKSAQTLVRVSSGDFSLDTFAKSSRFSLTYFDKANLETLELTSRPTIVEVKLDDLGPDDIYSVFSRIEKVFSKNYLGVITHQYSSLRCWTVLQDEVKKVSGLLPSDVLTWEILVALVIGLMLISILAFSLELLSKIETPLRFQRRSFEVSKEY